VTVAPERLRELFHPRSVALVGATDASAWSRFTHQNLRLCSPGVAVHLVHPRHREVHGEPVHRSIGEVPGQVDLAYVMVPTDQVLPVLEEAAATGVRNAVLLTAGFGEAGPEGRALEERLVAWAAERDVLLLGPNGNGFINATAGIAPYGLLIPQPLQRGPLGIVLQSGGLASVVLGLATARNIGVSHVVATGNEAMVSATDVLAYLVDDPSTRAIAAFLESVRDTARFRELAEAALRAGKAIVALKVGRSPAGMEAALAHTGAVAGDEAVVRAAFRQLGVVQVDSLEDLLVTAGLFAYHPRPLGRRVAAVTASGGACDLIADRATDEGLELPEFPAATTAALADLLPSFSNPRNPLDVTGYVVVDPSLSARSLAIVAAGAEGIYDVIVNQALLPAAAPPDPGLIQARYRSIAETVARSPVPVILQTATSTDISPFARGLLNEHGLYVQTGIDHGMRAIGHAVRWHEHRDRKRPKPLRPSGGGGPPGPQGGTFSEMDARAALARFGVPLVPAVLARTAGEAVEAARKHGYPAVVKAHAPGLAHKSDVGGVALDLRTPDDLAAAFARVTAAVPGAEGALVSPMRTGGVELLVGVRRDPAWGPVLALGLGGLWVEALRDTSLRLLPVDAEDVLEALNELKGAPLLRGGRGRPPIALDRVAGAVLAAARAAEELGEALDTLEINPLWASADAVEALDALVVWR
jgi:acetate---CoA ligase (ADP-forming)